jgi:hypothetical protein
MHSIFKIVAKTAWEPDGLAARCLPHGRRYPRQKCSDPVASDPAEESRFFARLDSIRRYFWSFSRRQHRE